MKLLISSILPKEVSCEAIPVAMTNNSNNLTSEILLSDIGKHYNNQWIFKGVNLNLKSGDSVAFKGNNGSGKSTLLQIISGFITPDTGLIQWKYNGVPVVTEQVYKRIALASPYLDLIEEFTLIENIEFYGKLKSFQNNISPADVSRIAEMQKSDHKPVKHFSSGMKQRLKLALAILSDSEILLLDEPLSNLDRKGYDWYHSMLEKYLNSRILVVCSNQVNEEISFCKRTLNIEEFKTQSH